MFDGSRGDRFLRRIAGRRSPTHTHESNYEVFGVVEDEERKIPRHGNFEGTV